MMASRGKYAPDADSLPADAPEAPIHVIPHHEESRQQRVYNTDDPDASTVELAMALTPAQAEAREAATVEVKAGIIDYARIEDEGIVSAMSQACHEIDRMFEHEIMQDSPEYELVSEPDGRWAPRIRLVLPRNELRRWRGSGGNVAQLKRLRGTVYTMLTHERNPKWWNTSQVTLTLNQVARAYWQDDSHKMTQDEVRLMKSSIALLVSTRVTIEYPPASAGKKRSGIDERALRVDGLEVFPAILASKTDANGHIVDFAAKFHALPPIDQQAVEISQYYLVPPLPTGRGAGRKRIEQSTLDVEMEVARYVRMAEEYGSATGYIDKIAARTKPAVWEMLSEDLAVKTDPVRRRQLNGRRRYIRHQVKKDVNLCLRTMVEREANRPKKPVFLNVDKAKGRAAGFVLTRVRQTRSEARKGIRPETHYDF